MATERHHKSATKIPLKLPFSHGFPMGFPMVFLCFPMVFLWFSYGFPVVFPWTWLMKPPLMLVKSPGAPLWIRSAQAAADKALEIDQEYSSIAEKVQAWVGFRTGPIHGKIRENHLTGAKRREFSGMIHWLTIKQIIPATPSNPSSNPT